MVVNWLVSLAGGNQTLFTVNFLQYVSFKKFHFIVGYYSHMQKIPSKTEVGNPRAKGLKGRAT